MLHENNTGTIGTGLFLGSASSLQNGGPLGLLLGYAIVGSICVSVMVSVNSVILLQGGHPFILGLARRNGCLLAITRRTYNASRTIR